MKKLTQIIKENKDFLIIRDWVIDDYNSNIGYNPRVNINQLLKILEDYKDNGIIYRVINIPKNINDVYQYIKQNLENRYASFSNTLSGANYYRDIIQNEHEKTVIISQNSEFYDLDSWYQDNIDELDKLENTGSIKWSWIGNLVEIENTYEVIAKQSNNFKIVKIY